MSSLQIRSNASGTDELNDIPTFNDDDWEAIFGAEDEVVDAKESSENSEPDAEESVRNGKADNSVLELAKNSPEISTVHSQRNACAAETSVELVSSSGMSSSVTPTQSTMHPEKQTRETLSSMIVMDLCMKREQKLRLAGNILEADALSTVGFTIMNMMAKVMELLQSDESINVGALMLEAVKASINKGSNEWESLILCTESICALVNEVRGKKRISTLVEGADKVGKKLNEAKHVGKETSTGKKRKSETVSAEKQEKECGKRKRVTTERTDPNLIHSKTTHQAEHRMENSNDDGNVILMAGNKFKSRQGGRWKQIEEKSPITEQPVHSLQKNVSDANPKSSNIAPNLIDDKNFTGPISAEALMEECEEADSNNPATLLPIPVQRDANHYYSQRSHPLTKSSKEGRTNNHTSSHIRNDPALFRMGTDSPKVISNNSIQSTNLSCLSNSVKTLSPSLSKEPQHNIRPISSPNLVRTSLSPTIPPAQKYGDLNFVKIRKIVAKPDGNVGKSQQKKNVLFLAESEYSVIEIPNDPNETAGEKMKEVGELPPREYNFFLGPTTSRPVGNINARSFCESCEFTRGDIRNWLIVGSRFDRLNEGIFDAKKNGCLKTHVSRANYPPVHFRVLSDALTHILINVAGLKIFLAVGEDWITKKSMVPEEFTSFIKRFARTLYELYVKQYTLEHGKEMELTDDLEKVEKGYAYVEMPMLILFTVPPVSDSNTEMKCSSFNSAIKNLVRNWDITSKSPYYHVATRQSVELKLIDWRQMCINQGAISNSSMIIVLMKHLMEEWGVCVAPTNRT
uniref:Uncharacterized protein n=1 Tax=Setaria digitata TaxID=48799 RepID=A0A915Q021_9BILA